MEMLGGPTRLSLGAPTLGVPRLVLSYRELGTPLSLNQRVDRLEALLKDQQAWIDARQQPWWTRLARWWTAWWAC